MFVSRFFKAITVSALAWPLAANAQEISPTATQTTTTTPPAAVVAPTTAPTTAAAPTATPTSVAAPTAPAAATALKPVPVKQSITMRDVPWERLPLPVKKKYPKEKWAALKPEQRVEIMKSSLPKPRDRAQMAPTSDPKRDAIRAKWEKMTPAERLKFKQAHPNFVPPPSLKKPATTVNKPNWDSMTSEERKDLSEKIKAREAEKGLPKAAAEPTTDKPTDPAQ